MFFSFIPIQLGVIHHFMYYFSCTAFYYEHDYNNKYRKLSDLLSLRKHTKKKDEMSELVACCTFSC